MAPHFDADHQILWVKKQRCKKSLEGVPVGQYMFCALIPFFSSTQQGLQHHTPAPLPL